VIVSERREAGARVRIERDTIGTTPPERADRYRVGVVVPIRAFALGKARLSERLDADARSALGRRLAERVVGAADGLDVVVVSSDHDVREWARERGVPALDDPGSLDAAAAAGRRWAADRGHVRLIVAHADLPRARSLLPLLVDTGNDVVAAVPCHRDDGTPVLSVPVNAPFAFAYGPDSFRRHAAAARRAALGFRVVRDPDLAFDVDVPADLVGLDDLTKMP
jgi:2-phospho-L-lactate guanylyltransferase